MQCGHAHVVAFLKSPPSRSDAPSVNACKPSSSNKRECANCGVGAGDRSDLLLKACSRCKLVFYCSEPCQRQHWKKGEHKRFCVAVCDRKAVKGDADSDALKSIETKPTKLSQAADVSPSDACAVCLEPLNKSITRSLPCGHFFHRDCMTGVESFGLSQKCPLCRSGLSFAGSK